MYVSKSHALISLFFLMLFLLSPVYISSDVHCLPLHYNWCVNQNFLLNNCRCTLLSLCAIMPASYKRFIGCEFCRIVWELFYSNSLSGSLTLRLLLLLIEFSVSNTNLGAISEMLFCAIKEWGPLIVLAARSLHLK